MIRAPKPRSISALFASGILEAGSRVTSPRRADARGQCARSLAGDVDEVCVRSELIERREELVGLEEQFIVVIFFDLLQDVVDAETVVAHGALEIGKIGLLAREILENRQKLRGRLVERVIEGDRVRLGTALIRESLLAEVGD